MTLALHPPPQAADSLTDCRYISAEFMYRPRPTEPRACAVFDYALRSRLTELDRVAGGVIWLCKHEGILDTLTPIIAEFPRLRSVAIVVNPAPMTRHMGDSPTRYNWEAPERWQRYTMTDRWARIQAALAVGASVPHAGWLIMPAHDAVWGRDLLARLERYAARYALNGLPAAVSPYTYYQHSPVPNVDIPPHLIATLNAAFNRDLLLPLKFARDELQAYWGKMGMIPFGMCAAVRAIAETFVWEDDRELDRAIRDAGYAVRCLWVHDPRLYRQALPVFTEADLRRVIERTLHYSLNIPSTTVGGSSLNIPLGTLGRWRQRLDWRFARNTARAEAVIADCVAEIRVRLAQHGASWVDWGDYRHVIRVGDAAVEVWKAQDLTNF
jgi:hypothetical protein